MPWAANVDTTPDYLAVTAWPEVEHLEAAMGFFYGFGVSGVEWEDGQPASPAFTDIPMAPGSPFVRAFFPDDDAWPDTWPRLKESLERTGWRWDIHLVRTQEWASSWKRYYQPVAIGDRYTVVPAWHDRAGWDPERTIFLDPGMAFGIGTHPTTRMCLTAILSLPVAGRAVLDLGSGSGILAILAAKRHAGRVVAVEPDPVAMRALGQNVTINGVDDVVTTVAGTLAHVRPEETFDLILANLIADIILSEWSALASRLQPGGHALLSGILAEKTAAITDRVATTGHRVVGQAEREGWMLLVVA
ncbi:MAG: 50S ribosomal protein L11 methyltransferase [Thermaerobacter sp.]|nr:50S ribosomal protein L11 methyltransferase [Thermaerobacter sp.]